QSSRTPGTPARVIARYQFKCDSAGRITEFTAPSGNVYICDYTETTTVENKTPKTVYQTVVRRKSDGLFQGRRDEIRDSGEWIVQRTTGGRNDDPSTGVSEYWGRLHKVGSRWTVSSYGQTASDLNGTFRADTSGNPVMGIKRDGA